MLTQSLSKLSKINKKVKMLKECVSCFLKKKISEFYTRYSRCKECWNLSRRRMVVCNHCNESYCPNKKGRGRFCSDKCRFLHKINKNEAGCWLWNAHVTKRGYGSFVMKGYGRSMLAHRAAYIIFRGTIPSKVDIMHTCDVPQCVNPMHLRKGNPLANSRDMVKKGRARFSSPGENHPSSKLKNEDVIKIREMSNTMKYVDIASSLGVTPELVGLIARRKLWKHL